MKEMLEQNYIFEIIRLELFDTIKEVLKQCQTVESAKRPVKCVTKTKISKKI